METPSEMIHRLELLNADLHKEVHRLSSELARKSSGEPSWEPAGVIGVDAGLCWIGDPCYCVTPDAREHPAQTWGEFCGNLRDLDRDGFQQFYYSRGHDGLGVAVSTGYGDGCYPVSIRRTSDGRVAGVRVDFVGEDDE